MQLFCSPRNPLTLRYGFLLLLIYPFYMGLGLLNSTRAQSRAQSRGTRTLVRRDTFDTSSGEKGISPVAVLNTFLTIVKLFKGAAELPSPANTRGRALLKLLVLSAMVSSRGIFYYLPRRLDF